MNTNVSSGITIMKNDRKIVYSRDRYGFLKQQQPQPFEYDPQYKQKQSTNPQMSWLRLGWLSAQIPFEWMRTFNVVDIGAGNGSFVAEGKKVFRRCVPYDVAGDSISDTELYTTAWDLIVMSDVLEHYHDIDEFWTLNFRYAMISFPEAPASLALEQWRHYKPNEHIYCLDFVRFCKWVTGHGHKVMASGCPEDMIRRRWNRDEINITTVLIEKERDHGV